jgi:hypothetical protein
MDAKYPIGKPSFTDGPAIPEAIDQIAALPAQIREAVARLGESRLDTPYREGGWTARQVVHHLVDSHVNSYCRFRLALTEDRPTIRPYDEKAWAELDDARSGAVDLSLDLLEALHRRWVVLLRSMKPEDFEREFVHPERGPMSLKTNVRLYAWHGRHHLAHLNLIDA